MRFIVIDSKAGTVQEVESSEGTPSLDFMQSVVGGYIEVAYELPNGDTIYVDEEGLMKEVENFIEVRGAHQPFAGNAVIANTDRHGETGSAKSKLEDIRKMVSFTTASAMADRYARQHS